jgi:hypothetical protein
MSFESNHKISTRIDADIAISNTYDTISILALTPYKIETHYVTTYFVTQHLNFMPVLKTNTDYNRGSKLTNIPLFTIHPPQQVRDTIKLDQNNFVAIAKGDYILIINIHSISNETFDYYSSMLGQTDNKDVFFELTPIQLNGNIKCVNQKSKTVYGLFQANSIVKKYYNVGDNYYLSQVNEVPELIYYYYTTRQRILK